MSLFILVNKKKLMRNWHKIKFLTALGTSFIEGRQGAVGEG